MSGGKGTRKRRFEVSRMFEKRWRAKFIASNFVAQDAFSWCLQELFSIVFFFFLNIDKLTIEIGVGIFINQCNNFEGV